ncbi:hypothetical protein HOG48_00290 [Candidatus Peregrinibacteria bacterium]|jgi:hypothetical protein|nr:hypothetical protein [Candidatus Peregrinibacteria bacterium]
MALLRLIPALFKKNFLFAFGLLFYNLLFIAGYVFWGWGVTETIFLFWFEAIILLIFIWLELLVLNKKERGNVIAYTLIFAWQLIVVLAVFYELHSEMFAIPNLDADNLFGFAVRMFLYMWVVLPALLPSMILLTVNFLVDFVKKLSKSSEKLDTAKCTNALFYSSLIHVYLLLVLITLFHVVGHGLAVLIPVVIVKIFADFSVALKEHDIYKGKDKNGYYISNPLFFTIAWFFLSALFILPMYLFDTGFDLTLFELILGVILLCFYGGFMLIFLSAFFNYGKK